MGFDAGDSNLYRYVMNSPFNATDPSGNDHVTTIGEGEDATFKRYAKIGWYSTAENKIFYIGRQFSRSSGLFYVTYSDDAPMTGILPQWYDNTRNNAISLSEFNEYAKTQSCKFLMAGIVDGINSTVKSEEADMCAL